MQCATSWLAVCFLSVVCGGGWHITHWKWYTEVIIESAVVIWLYVLEFALHTMLCHRPKRRKSDTCVASNAELNWNRNVVKNQQYLRISRQQHSQLIPQVCRTLLACCKQYSYSEINNSSEIIFWNSRVTPAWESGTRNLRKFLASEIWCKFMQVSGKDSCAVWLVGSVLKAGFWYKFLVPDSWDCHPRNTGSILCNTIQKT